MKEILEQLKMETQEASGYDGLSFCYGVVEIYPEENVTVSDILSKADDKMYQEKRRYHILKAQRSIQNKRTKTTQTDKFEYDKEHLYLSLIHISRL